MKKVLTFLFKIFLASIIIYLLVFLKNVYRISHFPKEEIKKDIIFLSHGGHYYIWKYPFLNLNFQSILFNYSSKINNKLIRIWDPLQFQPTFIPNCFFGIGYEKEWQNLKNSKKFFILYSASSNQIVWTKEIETNISGPAIISLSPSGKYIAYITRRDEKGFSELLIWKINFLTNDKPKLITRISRIGPHQLKIPDFIVHSFGWFPDEKSILLSIKIKEECKVVMFDLQSLKYKILENGEVFSLSNDGKQIVILSRKYEGNNIKIINLENNSQFNISISPLIYIMDVEWSSSGDGIYCIGREKRKYLDRYFPPVPTHGLYYVSIGKNQESKIFLIKRKAWLYWGGEVKLFIKDATKYK